MESVLICLNATSASCAARILAKDTPASGDQRVDRLVFDLRQTDVVDNPLTRVLERLREAELCINACSGVWIERCEEKVRQLLIHLLTARFRSRLFGHTNTCVVSILGGGDDEMWYI
jgi:hypothetical protein